MRRFLLLCLALVVAGCATLLPAPKELEMEGEKLFGSLLMPVSSDKENASCYAFYFRPVGNRKDYFHAYVLSAGHCPASEYTTTILVGAPEQEWQTVRPAVLVNNLKIETGHLHDFFIGYIAERRPVPLFFTVDEWRPIPDRDEYAMTVAEPIRLRTSPTLQKIQFKEMRDDGALIFEAELSIEDGFSGAPVATNTGRLLGILIGSVRGKRNLYLVMPIKRIMEEFRRHLQ